MRSREDELPPEQQDRARTTQPLMPKETSPTNPLRYTVGCLLCLYAGYEAHHLHEVLHPASRPVTWTLRQGRLETLPPLDDEGAQRRKEGPLREIAITMATSTSSTSMDIASGPTSPQSAIRFWSDPASGEIFFSEYRST